MPTCYSLDDMEAQVEAAYELEEAGIGRGECTSSFAGLKARR